MSIDGYLIDVDGTNVYLLDVINENNFAHGYIEIVVVSKPKSVSALMC